MLGMSPGNAAGLRLDAQSIMPGGIESVAMHKLCAGGA
jgi:hypothetical protein